PQMESGIGVQGGAELLGHDVVEVLVGDENGVGPGQRVRVAERSRVDHQHRPVLVEADTGMSQLGEPHRYSSRSTMRRTYPSTHRPGAPPGPRRRLPPGPPPAGGARLPGPGGTADTGSGPRRAPRPRPESGAGGRPAPPPGTGGRRRRARSEKPPPPAGQAPGR